MPLAVAKRIAVSLFLILVISAVTPANGLHVSDAQSSSSCPQNLVLRGADQGGSPNSLSGITAAGSSFYMADLLYRGVFPELTPGGTSDYNVTILDWYKSNANATQWTINIKPGLKWADGTPISSADILATYSDKFAFNSSYDFTGAHKEVTSETALNSTAVQFNLSQSDATFLFTLSQQILTGVYPAAAIKGPTTDFFNNTATSGPFYPVNYTVGSTEMKLSRNVQYQPEAVPCELDMIFPESYSTIASQMVAGSLDYGPIDAQSAQSILSHPDLHVFDQKGAGIIPLFYNITQYPLNMTQFRQALVYGVNQSQIVQQALYGYGEVAYNSEGTVPPGYATHYSNQMNYSYSPSTALSLLQSVGIKKGSDGHLQYPNGTDITLTIWGDSGFAEDTLAMSVLQSNLESLGFIVIPHLTQWGTVFSFTSLAPAELTFMDNTGIVPADPITDSLPGWDVYTVPPIPMNYWLYPPSANDAYMSNLSVVKTTTNPSNVSAALNNIQALSAKYLPVIPIVYYDSLFSYSTARWVNWPSWPNSWFYTAGSVDDALFSEIRPISSTTSNTNSSLNNSITTSSVSASSSIVSSATSLATSSSNSVSTLTTQTSSATSSASLGYTTIIVVAVVVIIIIAGVAVYALRRRA